MPKSSTLRPPSPAIIRCAGFRSVWTMRYDLPSTTSQNACAFSRKPHIHIACSAASSAVSRRRRSSASRDTPSISSIAMKKSSPSAPKSYTSGTMPCALQNRCWRIAPLRSASIRSGPHSPLCITSFSATRRPSERRRAVNTVPNEPRPIGLLLSSWKSSRAISAPLPLPGGACAPAAAGR